MAIDLSQSERERYAAQLDGPVGEHGQGRLKRARVLVVGAGAVGSSAAGHLAAAGVGHLSVADPQSVTARDLARSLLHFTPDIGVNKADAIAAKLGVLNPEVQVDPYPVQVDEQNAAAIAEGHDLVVDCSGASSVAGDLNVASATVSARIVSAMAGADACTITIASPGRGACLDCGEVLGPLATRGAERRGGAAGPIAGVAGALTARAALALLTSDARGDRVLALRLEPPRFEELELQPAADCRGCARIADLVEVGA